jgi:uncharacterized repeat protein (TIGR01451 family)
MKGLAWKLALLTAVMAVGFLVMLQAQRGMNQALLKKSVEEQAAAGGAQPGPPTSESDAIAAPAPPQKANPFSDSALGPDSKQDGVVKTVVVEPTEVAVKDTPQDIPKKPEQRPTSTTPKDPAASSDPFADGGDAKHPVAAADNKPAAPPELAVKQASGSVDAGAKAPDSLPDLPAQQEPTADRTVPKLPAPGPDLSAPSPNGSKSSDSKPADLSSTPKPNDPPKQAEPSPGPDLEPPGTPKSTGGPQIPAGPALDLPSMGNSGSKSDAKPGPSLPPVSPAGDSAAAPGLADKSPAKAAAPSDFGALPGESPKPFPVENGKEAPLSIPAPSAGAINPATPSPPVLDLTPAASAPPSLPETKSADATNAPATTPRPAAELHSDSPADFQGDGTVGEAAPLGPQRPQLNIEKVAPPNALIGQPLIYSILVKNVGQSAARDVVVEDRIPKGTKLSGTIPRAELTGKKLIWRIGTLAGGEQRKISIRVIPQEAGEIGSVATVNFVAEAAAETVVTAPRLEFNISAPSAARLGEMVPFKFEVKNVGTGEARGVVIRDLIPKNLSHGSGNDLEYEVGRLMPGKARQLTLELRAGKVGTAVNRAVVLAEGGLTTEAKATIEISGSKVALSRSGPQRRYLGRQAVFTNTLVNESSFPVDGVVLVESIPTGMEFAGASHGGQYNDGSRTVAWRVEPLAPGETRVVKSRLVAREPGNQTSTVRLTVPNGEPVEATSQTQVEGFAALGLDVTGVDGPVDLGEKLTLHVNARNKGTVSVTNLIVTVEIPDQMEVVSARGPGKLQQDGGRLKFGPMPTLEGRTAAACEIVLTARKRGDSRVRVSVQADQIEKPLAREESILILSESPEPTAAR